jgi:hypothetical protein
MRHSAYKQFALMAAFSFLAGQSAQAENPALREAIKKYNAGDYLTAAGLLGQAESADFNDPKLHYYLANTFYRLNEREAALREYRIAYALQPTGEVGSLSKRALSALDPDSDKPILQATDNALGKKPQDPLLQQASAYLRQQTDGLKSAGLEASQAQANGLGRLSDAQSEILKRDSQNLIDDILRNYRRPTRSQLDEVKAGSAAQAEKMRQSYETQKVNAFANGQKRSSLLDESATNLQQLMDEPGKPGKVRVDPAGTNLYVRNYQKVQETGSKPAQANAQTAPTASQTVSGSVLGQPTPQK